MVGSASFPEIARPGTCLQGGRALGSGPPPEQPSRRGSLVPARHQHPVTEAVLGHPGWCIHSQSVEHAGWPGREPGRIRSLLPSRRRSVASASSAASPRVETVAEAALCRQLPQEGRGQGGPPWRPVKQPDGHLSPAKGKKGSARSPAGASITAGGREATRMENTLPSPGAVQLLGVGPVGVAEWTAGVMAGLPAGGPGGPLSRSSLGGGLCPAPDLSPRSPTQLTPVMLPLTCRNQTPGLRRAAGRPVLTRTPQQGEEQVHGAPQRAGSRGKDFRAAHLWSGHSLLPPGSCIVEMGA